MSEGFVHGPKYKMISIILAETFENLIPLRRQIPKPNQLRVWHSFYLTLEAASSSEHMFLISMLQTANDSEHNILIRKSKCRPLPSNVVHNVLTRPLLGEHSDKINRSSLDTFNGKSVMH
jgi:hypothetical protein